jgi:hypothetical protein
VLRFEFGKGYTCRAPANFELKEQFVFLRISKRADVFGLNLTALYGKIVVIPHDSTANNRELILKLTSVRDKRNGKL